MKHIYPRPELREMSDIDFMIYEDDFTDTDRIVEEAGFVKCSGNQASCHISESTVSYTGDALGSL